MTFRTHWRKVVIQGLISCMLFCFAVGCAKRASEDQTPSSLGTSGNDPKESAALAAIAKTHQLLERRITLHVEGRRFRIVVDELSRLSGLNIAMSVELLTSVVPDAHLAKSPWELTPHQQRLASIALHAEQKTVRAILDELCATAGYRWVYPDPKAPENLRYGFIWLYPNREVEANNVERSERGDDAH